MKIIPLKSTGEEGHKNKKKTDTFLHVQTLHNRKTMSHSLGFVQSHMNWTSKLTPV